MHKKHVSNIICMQGLEQQLQERTRTLADVEAARKSQQQEWERKFAGMQEDSKAIENSWGLKVIFLQVQCLGESTWAQGYLQALSRQSSLCYATAPQIVPGCPTWEMHQDHFILTTLVSMSRVCVCVVCKPICLLVCTTKMIRSNRA